MIDCDDYFDEEETNVQMYFSAFVDSKNKETRRLLTWTVESFETRSTTNQSLTFTKGFRRSNSMHSTFDARIWWSTVSSLNDVDDVKSNSAGTSTKINENEQKSSDLDANQWITNERENRPARSPPNHWIIRAVCWWWSRLVVPSLLIFSVMATIFVAFWSNVHFPFFFFEQA